MNVEEEKVTVVHWGVSTDQFFPESEQNIQGVRNQLNLFRDYFMMVSCDIGRKNTELLMENFRNYTKQGGKNDLVLIWKDCPKSIRDEYKKQIEEKRIHLIGGISDDELRALYSGAVLTFFPSKYEGFGLPILESFACGTPVVTCRNSSLEEVGGKTAFYVPEDSETAMAHYMHEFEEGKYNRNELKQAALKHIQNFSWQKVAEEYIRFYLHYL